MSPEEKTARAQAILDGMADLWFAGSGFAVCNFPAVIVKAIKQAHAEGLYNGRCSNVDEAQAAERERCATLCQQLGGKACADAIRALPGGDA